MKNVLALFFAIIISFNLSAQEKLKSSKILYNQGLEELYELQKTQDGYLALGLKGDKATNKKLWLIKFNQKFEVTASRIIYNEVLENPFKLIQLPSGNTIILAQQVKNKLQQSLLISMSPTGRVLWSKVFSDNVNVELSDMVLVGNEIYLYGAKKHIVNQAPLNDKILLIKTSLDAQVLWQKEYEIGNVELTSKQLILDSRGDLLVTGTLVNLEVPKLKKEKKTFQLEEALSEFDYNPKKIVRVTKLNEIPNDTTFVEAENGDLEMIITKVQANVEADYIDTDNDLVELSTKMDTTYVEDEEGNLRMIITGDQLKKKRNLTRVNSQTSPTLIRSFYAIKFNKDGQKLNDLTANAYAQYAYANAIVEHDGGYLLAMNPADYFGDGLILKTDKNLKVQEKVSVTGTPIIFSGIQKHKDNIILGGIFSNTFNDYSPGFVLLNNQMEVQQAKTDKSLFQHFFITNMTDLDEGHFMLNGIGYEHGKSSDIYFLPFTSSGRSACDLKTYDVITKPLEAALTRYDMKNFTAQNASLQSNAIQFQLADEKGFESGNICTTPDQEPINRDENQSWSHWQNNNADVFGMKIPENWIQANPNPSFDGKFTVQYDGMQNDMGLKVIITDITGRQLQAKFLQNQDVFELDLSKYSTGIYNLSISDGHKSLTKKIEVLR